jgi:glycosyltransferase involved in cell wall biosynthesis
VDLVNTVSSKKSLSAVIATTKTFTHIETFKDTLTDASKYNIELILVHDNQDLESRILIREIISELPDLKIVLIEGVYGNPGTARNEGLKKATSDWVCFWDSDDTPHISEIMNAIASVDSETECIVGRFIKVDKSNGKRLVSSLPTLKNITFEPGLWRMVFKQRSLKNIEFPPLRKSNT